MTTILFVRHGSYNRLGTNFDPSLTSHGVDEATATATRLTGQPVNAVFASPLARAKQTAKIIAGPHGLPVNLDARLRERANFGDLPGQTVEEFVRMWERCNVDRTWLPPAGDSSQACGARVEAFVADRHADAPDSTIIAACHGGTIADFLRNVFTLNEIEAVNPALAATPYSGEIMRECSITVVRFDGSVHILEQAASISHLSI